MAYRFDNRDPDRPTFRRTYGGALAAVMIFGLLSAIGLTAGVGALLVEDVEPRVTTVVFGFGGLFGSALMLFLTRVRLPKALVFDTTQGGMVVRESARALAAPEAVLPFTDLAEFRLRKMVSQSGKSRSVSYVVGAHKKDGGVLELFRSGNRSRAQAVLDVLVERVDVTKPYQGPSPRPVDSRLRIQPGATASEISWPSRLNLGRVFASLALLASLAAIGVTLAWDYHLGAGVAVAVFFAVITLLVLRSHLRTFGARYVVAITGDELSYGWQGGILGHARERVPLLEVDTITFSFAASQGQQALLLLTPDQAASLRTASTREEHGASEIMGFAWMLMRARKLETMDLSFADKIVLEQALQEQLRARGAEAK